MSSEEMRHIRGAQIGMVFQDPMTSLNPVLTVGHQLMEPLILHLGMTKDLARERAAELLSMVGIPHTKERLGDYPYQFSGGMRQRVMIAMALACSPQILIADEPTTALDVTIQAQITDLVRHLRDEIGMAMIWVTHDLGVIAELAQRVLVMYGGLIIEEATVKELFADPLHPYTLGLLGSLPRVDTQGHQRLVSIDGLPPVLYEKPGHCPFAPRCKYAVERCWKENPPLLEISSGHRVACWEDIQTGKARQHD
jgi:oligopeptide transport system ATP-binding protein